MRDAEGTRDATATALATQAGVAVFTALCCFERIIKHAQARPTPVTASRPSGRGLHPPVADIDQAIERARHESAEIEREPVDDRIAGVAVMVDLFGHRACRIG